MSLAPWKRVKLPKTTKKIYEKITQNLRDKSVNIFSAYSKACVCVCTCTCYSFFASEICGFVNYFSLIF